MTGSLDVLESIGRKTFDAINDHDRAVLREKTKMLFERGESPQLTDLLKEAKEKTEIREKIAKENEEALKSDFMALFEEFQGLASLCFILFNSWILLGKIPMAWQLKCWTATLKWVWTQVVLCSLLN